jgi:hypothetical protein
MSLLCFAQSKEPIVDNHDSDDEIRAKIADANEFLRALQSANLHTGVPLENRTEAKIFDLKRQVALWQSILDKRDADRS